MPEPSMEALARRLFESIEHHARGHYPDTASLTAVEILSSVDLCRLASGLLAEFLVIPRSDITEYEYGYRHHPDSVPSRAPHGREQAIRCASDNAGDAVERPVLPWTVIPLPEDGE